MVKKVQLCSQEIRYKWDHEVFYIKVMNCSLMEF